MPEQRRENECREVEGKRSIAVVRGEEGRQTLGV